jgi:diaminohydroxyphosphoribosylaminopyrimidine deaminase/5-amino-6-(5-phosphoribosylamino)uracil reductase
MKLRAGADAILVGVNTIVQDDPSLTVRSRGFSNKPTRRIVLDPNGRSPLDAKVFNDSHAHLTTLVVTRKAAKQRLRKLSERVQVIEAPQQDGLIDLRWLLRKLGKENVTSILVEGGGETNAAFLEQCLAQRIQFFYAPMVLGGRSAPKAVGGEGVLRTSDAIHLRNPQWRRVGPDLLLTARVAAKECQV